MCDREEKELHPTDRSGEMSDSETESDSAAASFVVSVRNYLKTTHKTGSGVMEGGGEAPQDSRFRFCTYCGKGFESNKALYGHLRIHSDQYRARSKTETSHVENQRKPSPAEDEDDGFGCFVCNKSFSSMQLLCQHMRIHRETLSDGVRHPTMSLESKFKTTVKENDRSWSQTGEMGLKKTASDDDIMHDAVPLRAYYGPAPPRTETRKKRKTEETSTEGIAESTESPVGNSTAIDRFGNKSKPRSRMKKAKVMNSLHPCEICGKTFTTGQALGGHKTYHRAKDPTKVALVQPKPKQESCAEVKERVTKIMFPGLLPEDDEQARPKKMLDFDLNIPSQEE
ncbi:hypothetical protein F3Y22_tig00110557pilonHSYRG00098 [Hibiscus syriacus]|uniref:C2H2-type domain-containing protein n=1 Tax=Hibiscus syriacus TaxID=106335 RepID=A0A6A3A8G4_HIBSY|nr:zinc finger protein ZAT1-like [Hibiscus syriacus]KAE8700246.1 hypothetical protein F3Y22_tig00110557pilonHSYRG00098 [Hibiscus syriacus]